MPDDEALSDLALRRSASEIIPNLIYYGVGVGVVYILSRAFLGVARRRRLSDARGAPQAAPSEARAATITVRGQGGAVSPELEGLIVPRAACTDGAGLSADMATSGDVWFFALEPRS